MYQFGNPGTQPAPMRPKASKLRPTLSNPNLPAIEEKESDVDVRLFELSPHESPEGALSPEQDEKYMRFAETPSSEGPTDREVKMDKFGFPLFPQPLDDPNDPLTWSKATKLRILIQISLASFISLFSAFAIVSRYPFHISSMA
jgi:hypothetical protein